MATINDIGIGGVGFGMFMPKLNNRFRVTFSGIANGALNSTPLSMQVIQCSGVKITKEEVRLDRYNSVAFVAGKHMFEPLSMTVEDDISSNASYIIQQQIQQQQWLIGVEGQYLAAQPEASLYKFATIIDTLDGNETVLESWICEGCWIKEADFGEWNYTGNETKKIQLTIRFDHARQEIIGYKGGTSGTHGGVSLGGAGFTNGGNNRPDIL